MRRERKKKKTEAMAVTTGRKLMYLTRDLEQGRSKADLDLAKDGVKMRAEELGQTSEALVKELPPREPRTNFLNSYKAI